MKQLNFFSIEDTKNIPGLKYIESYITEAEEFKLLSQIDADSWCIDLKRRVQHYGYRYDYKSKKVESSHYIGSIPSWVKPLCNRLFGEGIFNILPNQIIVNEYLPGQGIASHIDCISCFDDTICSLTLGSGCVMEFSKGGESIYQFLEARSLLILKSEARYDWKHGIVSRKSDCCNGNRILRGRRVSLTFRKVKVQ